MLAWIFLFGFWLCELVVEVDAVGRDLFSFFSFQSEG